MIVGEAYRAPCRVVRQVGVRSMPSTIPLQAFKNESPAERPSSVLTLQDSAGQQLPEFLVDLLTGREIHTARRILSTWGSEPSR